jgi:hypothetical protein
VLATSRELTQRKRRNLEKRAEEKGFVLVQVYDQAAMSVRLYRDPAWCLELLNLTGAPSALSVVPRTRRPILGENLIGRDGDLEWLRASSGDRLLIGASCFSEDNVALLPLVGRRATAHLLGAQGSF